MVQIILRIKFPVPKLPDNMEVNASEEPNIGTPSMSRRIGCTRVDNLEADLRWYGPSHRMNSHRPARSGCLSTPLEIIMEDSN